MCFLNLSISFFKVKGNLSRGFFFSLWELSFAPLSLDIEIR